MTRASLFLAKRDRYRNNVFSLCKQFAVLRNSANRSAKFLQYLIYFNVWVSLYFLVCVLGAASDISVAFRLSVPTVRRRVDQSIFLRHGTVGHTLIE